MGPDVQGELLLTVVLCWQRQVNPLTRWMKTKLADLVVARLAGPPELVWGREQELGEGQVSEWAWQLSGGWIVEQLGFGSVKADLVEAVDS